jgi:hypothetical protein
MSLALAALVVGVWFVGTCVYTIVRTLLAARDGEWEL